MVARGLLCRAGEFFIRVISGPAPDHQRYKGPASAEAIAARLAGPSLVTGGRFPLLTVAALLSHCRLLVANDSGPFHMGLALGIPTIGLLGADDPRRVGPYQVDWGVAIYKREEVCAQGPCRLKKCPKNLCMEAIMVADVVEMIKTWWEPQWLGVRGRS